MERKIINRKHFSFWSLKNWTFSVLSKCCVPTMQNSFGKFDAVSYQEIILLSGVFRRETASGFYPWGKVDSPRKRVADGIVWLAAWKLVSNDAKRTVAPPNAKHSTLLQGCFLCFLFLIPSTIQQQCIIYPQKFSTEPLIAHQGNIPSS